jgi:hypothetical protein
LSVDFDIEQSATPVTTDMINRFHYTIQLDPVHNRSV